MSVARQRPGLRAAASTGTGIPDLVLSDSGLRPWGRGALLVRFYLSHSHHGIRLSAVGVFSCLDFFMFVAKRKGGRDGRVVSLSGGGRQLYGLLMFTGKVSIFSLR